RAGRPPGHPSGHQGPPPRSPGRDGVTVALTADLLGAAMVDFAAGRQAPAWLRGAPGRRLTPGLAAYFAPVTAHERALLDLAEGPVLDVGCGPARHARLLQARGPAFARRGGSGA